MKQVAVIALAVLLIVLLPGCISELDRETEDFDGEYDTNDNTTVKVYTNNGDIDVSTWDGDKVSLHVLKSTHEGKDELEKLDIVVTEAGDVVDIKTEFEGTKAPEVTADMTVKVPRNVRLERVRTSNGDIVIKGTKGNLTATNSNGDIDIDDIEGYVTASSSNGNVDVRDTTGNGDVSSSNGKVFAEVRAFLDGTDVHSSNGAVTVYINPSLDADLEIYSSNGKVSAHDLTLDRTMDTNKRIEGTLGNGGDEISVYSSNGDVDVYKLE
jgi:DUF4097 and DUF4098 domain-containing protein YvlB